MGGVKSVGGGGINRKDQQSVSREEMSLKQPKTRKVTEFLTNYTALYGIPREARTEHGIDLRVVVLIKFGVNNKKLLNL